MSEYDVCVEAAKIQLWVIVAILAAHFLYFVTIGWRKTLRGKDGSLGDEKEQIVEDLREGAAFLRSGWSWGGIESRTRMPCCRTDMASVLEAAANRFERGEHRKENDDDHGA